MVDRFEFLYLPGPPALPAPAQAQLDGISSILPSLKQTLERVDTLDPTAQDARRLMSIHLPGLIDRYGNVPDGLSKEQDGEGKTVDERLVESLAAARSALDEVSRAARTSRHGGVRNPRPLHQIALRRARHRERRRLKPR